MSDIAEVIGSAILDAILAGERDPAALAQHRDHRVRATAETIAKALVGDYQPEHFFTLFSELGATLAPFLSGEHFASWLGLSPDNRISWGEFLSVQTPHVKHRVAEARLDAQSLSRSRSVLGGFCGRMRAKLGIPAAIAATAHKLARNVFHLLTIRQSCDESRLAAADADQRRDNESWLRAQARTLGFQLMFVTVSQFPDGRPV